MLTPKEDRDPVPAVQVTDVADIQAVLCAVVTAARTEGDPLTGASVPATCKTLVLACSILDGWKLDITDAS